MIVSHPPPELAYTRAGVVYIGAAAVARGHDPSVSADGRWIAYVSGEHGNPELYVARPGQTPVRITFTPRAAEAAPAWSPDGRHLAFQRDRDLWIGAVDRGSERLVARNASSPSWSSLGRIAFERGRWIWSIRPDGLQARKLVRGAAPSWTWDNRLAYERDGAVYLGPKRVANNARAPAVATDGRIAFERRGAVWASGDRETRLRAGTQPAWRSRLPAEPKPDLDQLAPQDLSLLESGGRVLLGFASAVRNIGDAPMELVASRSATTVPVMTAAQRLARRLIPNVGLLRYRHADNHLHWHYLAFERYELRTLDGRFLVRDRKSGFCLVDRHPGPGRRPVFLDNCGQYRPDALRVRQGVSPGSTDIYPAYYHGQNLDVTGLATGTYVLVHRVNPKLYLEEADYTNNAAAVVIRLSVRGGQRAVRVLRRCESTERC